MPTYPLTVYLSLGNRIARFKIPEALGPTADPNTAPMTRTRSLAHRTWIISKEISDPAYNTSKHRKE